MGVANSKRGRMGKEYGKPLPSKGLGRAGWRMRRRSVEAWAPGWADGEGMWARGGKNSNLTISPGLHALRADIFWTTSHYVFSQDPNMSYDFLCFLISVPHVTYSKKKHKK